MKHNWPEFHGGWTLKGMTGRQDYGLLVQISDLLVLETELTWTESCFDTMVRSTATVLQHGDLAMLVGEPWRSAVIIKYEGGVLTHRKTKMWSGELWAMIYESENKRVVCVDTMTGLVRHVIASPGAVLDYAKEETW